MINSLADKKFQGIAMDESAGNSRWLVSYSDFMTLLFAFFVVMYSISQVSEEKYRVLSAALQENFSSQPLSDIKSGDSERKVNGSEFSETLSPEYPAGGSGLLDGGKVLKLDALQQDLYSVFNTAGGEQLASISGDESRLEVTLDADVLFSSGSAKPSYLAEFVFEDVTRLLTEGNNRIEIEGHTDNRAIASAQFPSNWQLSSARASSVVQLLEGFGIDSRRLSATGYGETQPVDNNLIAEGRANNRRVVLVIFNKSANRGDPLKVFDERTSFESVPNSILDSQSETELQPQTSSNNRPGQLVSDSDVNIIPLRNGDSLFTNDSRSTLNSRRDLNPSETKEFSTDTTGNNTEGNDGVEFELDE